MATPELTQRPSEGDLRKYQLRYLWLLAICLVAFSALGVRLWQIQIVEGEKYHRVSTENVIRQIERPGPRGEILDSHGVPLAKNRATFDVYVDIGLFRRHADEEMYEKLRDYLRLSGQQMSRLRTRIENDHHGEMRVAQNVARADVARLEEDRLRLPGVEVRPRVQRYYPLHYVGAHSLGYVSEIGPRQLRDLRPYGYRPGDYVGRMGLESYFDGILHGSPGLDRMAVDARGNRLSGEEARFLVGEYQEIEPVPGRDLVTTLDADLMVIIDEAMQGYAAGAAVAVDPNDGAVLAMYSKPHFNPNAWSGRLSSMERMRSDTDPFRPMVDKSVNGFFPGSVYKIVGTLAGLEDEVVTEHDEYHCPGFHNFGGHRFRCWRRAGHGRVDAYEAMAQSCDVYYYELAERLGMDRLEEYARRFGFGELTGIQLGHERSGRVPSRQWHQENSPEGYQRGFDLNTVLGQGDTLVTPLQLAMAYAAIANGGDLYYPRLVDEVRNKEGQTLFSYEPTVRKRVEMDPEHLEVLRESLRLVVHGPRGTARGSALSHTKVAGKTGTAQVARLGTVRIPHEERELHLRNHAWFVAYAPYDDPEIAVAVFLEHGGGGGGDAAPVAMEILDRYFTREGRETLALRLDDPSLRKEEP